MAIHIPLDSSGNPDNLHLVLATKSGRFLYALPATSIKFSGDMTNGSEISFVVDKALCASEEVWDAVVGFRLVYCPEIDLWYQIKVEVDESVSTTKNVTATSLGEAELSKIKVYNIEINTESDIERDDYTPTVLYNESNPEASLIDRLLYKAPHYRVAHVDDTLKNLQRTFAFSDKSVRDCFMEIQEELDCLFVLNANKTDDKHIDRTISVYDLENYCNDCGARGEFYGVCDICGSTNISNGYGKDTSIFVSVDNLADDIRYSTNDDEIMNCFRLVAGDDLMTATVVNCNPNGSQYIWYFSDSMIADMSADLQDKITDYNNLYSYYQNEYSYTPDATLRQQYNQIVNKYSSYRSDLLPIPSSIVGYPALMNIYYDAIDLEGFLDHVLMPTVIISDTTAATECAKLTATNLSPIAVADLSSCSATTAANAVLSMAKCIVDNRYQVKINSSAYNSGTHVWTGRFDVVSNSDEDDAATSASIRITINDDVEKYTEQKIEKMLNQKTSDITDIATLFDLELADFTNELPKYCRQRLIAFREACQAIIDVLIQQGIADSDSWADADHNPYENLYEPYLAKMAAIEAEIAVRENEIAIVAGKYDEDDVLIANGIQSLIVAQKDDIQSHLDFEEFLGEELWLEFAAYRRDDTYTNQNYISDGLDNAELFKSAQEFLQKANKEIFKSAMLQHTISASVHDLLIMPEFEPLIENFDLGNWIRIRVDDKIFRLRLSKYIVDYDSWNLSVEFTDVREGYNAVNDIQNILSSARSMATSYSTVARQASAGQKSKVVMDGWASDGFSLTTKIVGGANNQEIQWDDSGLSIRELIPETGNYSLNQIKLLSTGLYVTDDGWVTAKAGVGKFNYKDPRTNVTETKFGVIADTLVGNLILSEEVGIFNDGGSLQITSDGFVMNSRATGNTAIFTINRQDNQGNLTPMVKLNAQGQLVLGTNVIVEHVDASAIDAGTISVDRIEANSIDISKLSGSITLTISGGDNWKVDLENQTITLGSMSCNKLTGTLPIGRFGNGIITAAKLHTDVQTSLSHGDTAYNILNNSGDATISSATVTNLTATSFTFNNKAVSLKHTTVMTSSSSSTTIYYLGYTQ